jgi:hypothetical protein
VTFDGPVELEAEIRPASVTLMLENVVAGAIVVIYADDAVPAEMRRIQAERVALDFEPMPEG